MGQAIHLNDLGETYCGIASSNLTKAEDHITCGLCIKKIGLNFIPVVRPKVYQKSASIPNEKKELIYEQWISEINNEYWELAVKYELRADQVRKIIDDKYQERKFSRNG